MKDAYVHCYLAGRCDYDEDGEFDMNPLIEKVMSGSPLRDVTHAAAKVAVTKELGVREKADWLRDNADIIKEMGGDSEKAWRLYMQGRVDALASDLETGVIDAISEEEDEDDDEDEDEDEDGDDEGDDDGDGDDDEEDEPS